MKSLPKLFITAVILTLSNSVHSSAAECEKVDIFGTAENVIQCDSSKSELTYCIKNGVGQSAAMTEEYLSIRSSNDSIFQFFRNEDNFHVDLHSVVRDGSFSVSEDIVKSRISVRDFKNNDTHNVVLDIDLQSGTGRYFSRRSFGQHYSVTIDLLVNCHSLD